MKIKPQTLPRTKIAPNGPRRGIQKRKIIVPYKQRDSHLTSHQESWARSLTVSLSGWRSRKAFLKAQLEAQESERRSQEAVRQAAVAYENDRKASTQNETTEQSVQKPAVWKKRTSKMHQAGIENQFEGDSDGEESLYRYSSERSEQFPTLEPEQNSQKNHHVIDNDLGIEISDMLVSRKPQLTLDFEPAPVIDWRVKARHGILKKKLSIGKEWSAVTWNQKSNIQERLLLLEEDGIDITGLQDRKASSEELTTIVLERATLKQQPQLEAQIQLQGTSEPELLPSAKHTPEGVAQASTISQSMSPTMSVASPPPEVSSPSPDPPGLDVTPTIPPQQPVTILSPQDTTFLAVKGNTQSFCPNETYQPQASSSLKRKRQCVENSEDSEDIAAESHVAPKKHKCKFVTDEDLQQQAAQEIKQKVLRRIFRPTRSICLKPSPPSRVIFSSEISPTDCQKVHTTISTLDYLYSKQCNTYAPDEPLYISSQGHVTIMKELRFLTNTSNEGNDHIYMYDPDFDEQLDYSSTGTPNLTKESRRDSNRENPHIAIFENERGHQIVQGETKTLAALFKVLREQHLLHCVKWEWDGLQLRPSNGFMWSLSPETLDLLMEVEQRLLGFAEEGGMEVRVKRDGKAGERE